MNEKIYVIDDDEVLRYSLSMLLETAGHRVESYESAMAFLRSGSPGSRGCIILDARMPGMDGPALQAELARQGVNLPVIFLTAHGSIPNAVSAIKAGAVDFLTKPVDGALLLARVHEALVQNRKMADRIEKSASAASLLARLTNREREILSLAIAGNSNKEIARILGISYRTVEIHRSQIMKKTGAANLLELARIASQAL